jgi:ABC-type branched-subunit amino acid transport system permease subunit
VQQLLNGIFIGSIYALFAIGFTLVFGILDRLNLAHPAVFAASAFVGIELVERGGLSPWAACRSSSSSGRCSVWSSSGWRSVPSRAGPMPTSLA